MFTLFLRQYGILREIAAVGVTGAGFHQLQAAVQLNFHSARDDLNLNSKDKGLDLTDTELWDLVAPTNNMPVGMFSVGKANMFTLVWSEISHIIIF